MAAGGGHGRFHVEFIDFEVAAGLVDEHRAEVGEGGPESGVVGAGVAHDGEARRGERVVDDGDVHVSKNTTAGAAGRGRRKFRWNRSASGRV